MSTYDLSVVTMRVWFVKFHFSGIHELCHHASSSKQAA